MLEKVIEIVSFVRILLFGFLLIFILFPYNSNAKELTCPPEILKEFKKYPNYRQLIAIAKKESGFNPKAQNGSCYGLMQVHISVWHKKLVEKNVIKNKQELYTIKGNIKVGAYILKHYNYNYTRYKGKKITCKKKR